MVCVLTNRKTLCVLFANVSLISSFVYLFICICYIWVVDFKVQKIDIVISNHITFSHAQKNDEAM